MVCQSRLISTCINRTAIHRKAAAPCPFCMIAAASDFDPHYQDFLFQMAVLDQLCIWGMGHRNQ